MSDIMYAKRVEIEHSSSTTEVIKASQNQASNSVRSRPLPLWTKAWGNRPPPGLSLIPNTQVKLTVSQPGDIFEQEADRIANQITQMPIHSNSQFKCASGRTAGPDRESQAYKQKQLTLQRRATNISMTSNVPPIVQEVLHAPGQSLDIDTRTAMESRFGRDFSVVRVYTDARAAESAQALSARAYTVGQNMVFGTGQHAPRTIEGARLLAHELTHVVQQNGQQSSLDRAALPPSAKSGRLPGSSEQIQGSKKESHWAVIVPNPGKTPGGWKATQTFVTFVRPIGLPPQSIRCDFEVGVPIINYRGPVSDAFADSVLNICIPARASDVQKILNTRTAAGIPISSAEVCNLFKKELQNCVTYTIPGAKVGAPLQTRP